MQLKLHAQKKRLNYTEGRNAMQKTAKPNLSNGVVQTTTRMAELLQKITYLNSHVAQTRSMAKMLNNIAY